MRIARDPRLKAAGFTLIELMISSALMAMILVAGYLVLNACLASQKLIEPRLEVVQNARVALAIMTADLRGACPLAKDYDLLGTHRMLGEIQADSLDFATHNYTPGRPHEGDYCQESFFVDKDPETGELCLWRRRNPIIAFDPLSGGTREEIARGVHRLQFEYYDGLDWYDDWGSQDNRKEQTSLRYHANLTGLPEAVRITLWLEANTTNRNATAENAKPEPPMVFQTVARLNLSTLAGGGSAGASNANNSAVPAGPSGPAEGRQ